MNSSALCVSIVAGVVIELFFQLIKYNDHKSDRITLDELVNYQSVHQFVSSGSRKWLQYFMFRYVPPAIILTLLAGILQQYLGLHSISMYLIISAMVSILPRDVLSMFKSPRWSERLVHIVNTLTLSLIAFVIGLLSTIWDFSVLTPNINDIINNLWGSLLTSMIVVGFLKTTNMNGYKDSHSSATDESSLYIMKSYTEINIKFRNVINSACQQNNCSQYLLYAILINENMNRPHWIRKLENGLVRVFGITLTVGLAQIKSDTPISDSESILFAAEILRDSREFDSKDNMTHLRQALIPYNSSIQYLYTIASIIACLKQHVTLQANRLDSTGNN